MSLVPHKQQQNASDIGWGVNWNAYQEREKGGVRKDPRVARPGRSIGLKQLGGSVLQAKSRNSVAAQQRLVNVQARMPKNEQQLRQTETGGVLRNMYAPPARDIKELDGRTGLPCLFVARAGGSMRSSVTNVTPMRIVANTAGLSRSLRFVRAGVIRGQCYVSDPDSPDLIAVTIKGVQTLAPLCSGSYHAGDAAAVDLNGYWVKSDGGVVPGINAPVGLVKNSPYLVVRPIPAERSNAMIFLAQDAILAEFGTTSFGNRVNKCTTAEDLMALMISICDNVFNVRYPVSEDMPIRGYALVWATWRFIKMLQVIWARIKLSASYNHAQGVAMAYRALLLVLRAAEDKFPRVVSAYPVDTPIEGPSTSPYKALLSGRESIRSNDLVELLTPADTHPETLARLQEAIARLDMAAVHYMHIFLDENRAWFESFFMGRFLSSGRGIEQADLLLE